VHASQTFVQFNKISATETKGLNPYQQQADVSDLSKLLRSTPAKISQKAMKS
jgi:hypothetical protein